MTASHQRDLMRILSWNIHDAMSFKEGPKADDEDFVKVLTGCNIFCLQETKAEFHLPNFKCYNSLRTGSRSGGLCVGVHRSLSGDFRPLKSSHPDIQAVTFCPATDDTLKFTIINVYDSPEQSSYKKRLKNSNGGPTQSTLESIIDLVAENTDLGEKLVLGDFNARTGDLNFNFDDEPPADTEAFSTISSFPENSTRSSKDSVVNPRGKLFLDFISSLNLSILNGDTLGDIFGEPTSINYNGNSVVDYVTATPMLKESVQSLKVLDLTKFSDHRPCLCTLKLRHKDLIDPDEILSSLELAPIKHKWDENASENRQQFLDVQQEPQFASRIAELVETVCVKKEDVIKLNENIVGIYRDMADQALPRPKKHKQKPLNRKTRGYNRAKPKSPWFDIACIIAKRDLNRLAKSYGKSPLDKELRDSYYNKRREYRKLVRQKKAKFVESLCRDVDEGRDINWSRFKKLKSFSSNGTKLDVFDMMNFCKFFKELYAKPSSPNEETANFTERRKTKPRVHELVEALDKNIEIEELRNAIKGLKKGKAIAEDKILNEFLISSDEPMLSAVLNLFNHCLKLGEYPWTTSLVTPLHKKGSVYDPNNYRAIAVASNVGKLFSTILLQRLLTFRSLNCPDTINQLGFCKKAQTSDHILKLSTCIQKYVTQRKKRLYGCFVDYAKAFDSVCREAMLYKLWELGVRGRYFQCIEQMYSHSSAKIKLLNRLSEIIDIHCGTEQGHPMSPELFKCFIHQLSLDLDNAEEVNVPELNKVNITHLLWADDLILLALDHTGLQKLLNVLHSYCIEWGLTVNIGKTAVMVFNRSGRLLKESLTFQFGETNISSVREYCYLGITFALTGSLAVAQNKLKQKGLRSYFALKSSIDLRHFRRTIVFKLFDALVVPIVTYGCQVWLPETLFIRNYKDNTNTKSLLKETARDPLEKLHLSFLKWTLGVGRKTSNASVWGDTGRCPLVIKASKQVFGYFDRLEQMDRAGCTSLARQAYVEQRTLNLPWYKGIEDLRQSLQSGQSRRLTYPNQFKTALRSSFTNCWNEERQNNRKLSFYNTIKNEFTAETYLNLQLSGEEVKRLAQFRMSAHKFNIETGRYAINRENPISRICKHCSSSDLEAVGLLAELPMFEPIIEDEKHVLTDCSLYDDLRRNIGQPTRTMITSGAETFADLFKDILMIRETARFLSKVNKRRFPRAAEKEGH